MKKLSFLQWVWVIIALTVTISTQDVAGDASEIKQIRRAITAQGANWVAAENWVTRLSAEDRKKLCGAIREPIDPSQTTLLSLPSIDNLPPIFDWRDNNGNWVTPVRNQGGCGSCWDFSAVAQVEAWWNIHHDDPYLMPDLSEQFVLSCSEGSCDGWSTSGALEFIRTTGIPTEACFEYTANDRIPCGSACSDWADEAITIPGWGYITLVEANVENIKNAVFRHPVSAGYDVYADFYSYSGGVYEHVWGAYEAGHAILIVGWNDEEESWICKNSWDEDWGESGYFRIRWGNCGIGEGMPFIWDEMTTGPALAISPHRLDLSMVIGASAVETITLTNLGSDVIEYAAMDIEVEVHAAFHPDAFNALDDFSWWCGDPDIGGYGDHWLQYLDTPPLDLSNTTEPRLTWMGFWSVESPADPIEPYDGWDGCNAWVSVDGGETFDVAQPNSPAYNCQSLWSFGHPEQGWNLGTDIAGWGGTSRGWKLCDFDLSDYTSNSVIIRFAFASDLAYCTQDDPSLLGFFVDEIQVMDGSEILFQDHGNNANTMTKTGYAGDYEGSTWIDISGGMGEIGPTESAQVTLTIRTDDLEPGSYHSRVQITSNDPANPAVDIPIDLKLFADTDGDGIVDIDDNCPNEYNPGQEDADEDGVGNICDNCPNDSNPDQSDADGDGDGDVCDSCTDTDGDGYGDPGYPANTCEEDNCPLVSNPDQAPAARGDVDCSGDIDVLDALVTVNHTLATIPLYGAPLERADCNGDGSADIVDALGMINVFLGLGECAPGASKPVINREVMQLCESLKQYLSPEEFEQFMTLVKAEIQVPAEHALSQNHPNPFNACTDIGYHIADSKSSLHTTLKIYNILGQEVRTLVDGLKEPGYYTVTWDGKNSSNSDVPSGVYFYRLVANDFAATKRIVLLK